MKKLLLIITSMLLSILLMKMTIIQADTLVYPFDSITITEAFTFKVEVTDEFGSNSLLFGLAEIGGILSVYVGILDFEENGTVLPSSSTVLIISNDDGEDLVRFLINNYTFYEGNYTSWGFASHILIDPEVGVYKDLSILNNGIKEMVVYYDATSGLWSLKDNLGLTMIQLDDSYEHITDINIVISVYEEEE